MLHLLPKPILVALLRVLVWIGAPDSIRIDVWAAIRAHEIAEERAWVAEMCAEICAYPARGGAA
jgi:hypothetical protein